MLYPVNLGNLADAYIAEALSWSLTLFQRVTSVCGGVTTGTKITFLPLDVDVAQLTSFEQGSIIDPFDPAKLLRVEGTVLYPVSNEAALNALLTYARDRGILTHDTVVICEDRLARITDTCIKHTRDEWVSYGDEVYRIVGASEGDEQVSHCMRSAASHTTCTALCAFPPHYRAPARDANDSDMDIWVASCVAVTVTAFDGEGFILWVFDDTMNN
jgi:hypothetical protein